MSLYHTPTLQLANLTRVSSKIKCHTIRHYFIKILQQSGPLSLSFCSSAIINFCSLCVIGWVGDVDQQAGYGLGLAVGNLFLLTICQGMTDGLDTLCPRAVGQGRIDLCYKYLIQSLVSSTIIFIPISSLLWGGTDNLLFWVIGYRTPAITHAISFVRYSMPGVLSTCYFDSLRKFLFYVGNNKIQALTALGLVPVHFLNLYVFAFLGRGGCTGMGIARSLTAITGTAILTYIVYRNYHSRLGSNLNAANNPSHISSNNDTGCDDKTIFLLDHADTRPTDIASDLFLSDLFLSDVSLIPSFAELARYFEIAVPSAALTVIEWASYELQVFEIGPLGSIEVVSLIATDGWLTIFFCFAMGISVAVGGEAGNMHAVGSAKDVEFIVLVRNVASGSIFI